MGYVTGTDSYQAAPSFAYIIGEYTLDRNGVLTDPRNSQLMLTLDQDGYRTKQNGQPRSRHDAGCGCPALFGKIASGASLARSFSRTFTR